ncbi:uncharacterized protein (DUF1800 family) [Arcicella aurantiaca]|uniref:Uncharacterized protein (DUF1800 family) n=1 Tax=Arcicella aurantiaca TaxID=591202 RepID=A0A316EEZ6_9BACT|nr:DUF1800 domain-containing protein [Arcicella aurantiaca]PWK28252.1 uncharacterized protein (DUF1800 family) [Arcicella aurantiaca]
MALIDAFTQNLTARQVTHLLRRASFGATPAQVKEFTGKKSDFVVQKLLATQPIPSDPTDENQKTSHDLVWGGTGTNDTERNAFDGTRRGRLKLWWVGLMISQPVSLLEKTTLFWQNHFVSTSTEVSDVRFLYRQNQLLRKYAFGNFKEFVIEITKDPSMLIYLDGASNVVGKPNENYARELMELFTIGRGNYTEDDVKAAARVLTGWRSLNYRNITSTYIGSEFRSAQHDVADKVFSDLYQKKTIKSTTGTATGENELKELIDMILAQPETARFIVRKFYRWFVQADISEQIEKDFIEPLAAIFRKNYDIKITLQTLFNSQHFYDETLWGSQIKSPADLVIGTLRNFNYQLPDPVKDRTKYDAATNYFNARLKEQQMDIIDQPNVFGWRPYYDTDFYEIWINSTTLALRGSWTDYLVKGATATALDINTLGLPLVTSDPRDPYKMVKELTDSLLSFSLTDDQVKYLVEQPLMAGSPYYEWVTIWDEYTNAPTNATKKNNAKTRLDRLVNFILRLAEFQMG